MSFCCPIHGYYAPVPGATLALCPSCAGPRPLIPSQSSASPQIVYVVNANGPDAANRHHPDAAFDLYEAVNLLQALEHAPDTGDWNGQLRIRCQAVIDRAKQAGLSIPDPCPWPEAKS